MIQYQDSNKDMLQKETKSNSKLFLNYDQNLKCTFFAQRIIYLKK
jgi:hypothetical protein